jgi:hypothetical protein
VDFFHSPQQKSLLDGYYLLGLLRCPLLPLLVTLLILLPVLLSSLPAEEVDVFEFGVLLMQFQQQIFD